MASWELMELLQLPSFTKWGGSNPRAIRPCRHRWPAPSAVKDASKPPASIRREASELPIKKASESSEKEKCKRKNEKEPNKEKKQGKMAAIRIPRTKEEYDDDINQRPLPTLTMHPHPLSPGSGLPRVITMDRYRIGGSRRFH